MVTNPGIAMGLLLLGIVLLVVKQTAAESTAQMVTKQYPTVVDLKLYNAVEAWGACGALSLMLATEEQVKALETRTAKNFKQTKCGFMTNGKAANFDATTGAFTECPDVTTDTTKPGYNAWCIEVPFQSCPKDWKLDSNTYSCYLSVPAKDGLNFADAKKKCNGYGGYLATIESAKEQTFLEGIIATKAYIGAMTASDKSIDLQWHDGTMEPAKPPAGSAIENDAAMAKCITIDKAKKNKWTKTKCDEKIAYICQKDRGYAPKLTVQYEYAYESSTTTLSENCFTNLYPAKFGDEMNKLYTNADTTTYASCKAAGVEVNRKSVVYANTFLKKTLSVRWIESFTYESKNYADVLACARTVGGKRPAAPAKLSLGTFCPELTRIKDGFRLQDKQTCKTGWDSFDGRSCMESGKAMSPFEATDGYDLYAGQSFVEIKGKKNEIVMTKEKCEAICTNKAAFDCRSFSYKKAAKGGAPETNICKISAETASMYGQTTAWAKAAGVVYYSRIARAFAQFAKAEAMTIEQKYVPVAAVKPPCVDAPEFADAGARLFAQFRLDTNKVLAAAYPKECGMVLGMSSFNALVSDSKMTAETKVKGSITVSMTVQFTPTTPFLNEQKKDIFNCINKFVAKASLLKSAAKYTLSGGKCKDVEMKPAAADPTIKLVAGKDAETLACKYLNTEPTKPLAYFFNSKNTKSTGSCFSYGDALFPYGYQKGYCTKAGTATEVKGVDVNACSYRCNALGKDCEAFAWNPTTATCQLLKTPCTDAIDEKKPEIYYLKASKTCEKEKDYIAIQDYMKSVLDIIFGEYKEKDTVCKQATLDNVMKNLKALEEKKLVCAYLHKVYLKNGLALTNAFRAEICAAGDVIPKVKETDKCQWVKAIAEIKKFAAADVFTAIVKSREDIVKVLRTYHGLKGVVEGMVKDCQVVTKLKVMGGGAYIFNFLTLTYPTLEPFNGPPEECQYEAFYETVKTFYTRQASAAKGAKVDAADICASATNVKNSAYLFKSCQGTLKQTAELQQEAVAYSMTGVCEKGTKECVNSVYVQCFLKRTLGLTVAFAEGHGRKSKICFNNTKENFNKDLKVCMSNTAGCQPAGTSAVSSLYGPMVDAFFLLCDQAKSLTLNWYFMMNPTTTVVDSAKCLKKEAVECLKGLNNIMIETLASGSTAASTQTCSSFEQTLACLKRDSVECSAPTRLNLYQTLVIKRDEIKVSKAVCDFEQSKECTDEYTKIDVKMKLVAASYKSGKYDCEALDALKVTYTAFYNAKKCDELTMLYVKAGYESIVYFYRDSCSKCAKSAGLKNMLIYENAFFAAITKFWTYEKSAICTGAMSITVLESSMTTIAADCLTGGSRMAAVVSSTREYKELYCKKRDMTWLVPKAEKCDTKIVDACIVEYTRVYLIKFAGDEQSVKSLCVMQKKMELCVIAAIKTCNDVTQTGYLSGLAYLRHITSVQCVKKPEEKECSTEEAYKCLSRFQLQFTTYMDLLAAKKNPKPIAMCGELKVAKECIAKYTVKCESDYAPAFVLFLKKSVAIREVVITQTCAGLEPKPCASTENFKCLVTYAESVVQTLTMVDTRSATLCKTKQTEKVMECAASTTLDCGARTKYLLASVKGLERSTEKSCKKLVCRQDDAKANVLFVLDASGSVKSDNFVKCKKFVEDVAEQLHLGQKYIRIGAMTYSTRVSLAFGFNRYDTDDKEKMLDSIMKIPYTKGGTYTHVALSEAGKMIDAMHKERGDTIPTIVIITTDGKSKHESDTIKAANALKAKKNVVVFGVAIGKKIRKTELVAIGSDPAKTVYYVDKFDQLDDIISDLSQKIVCDSLKQTPGTGVTEPKECELVEAEKCLATYEKGVFEGFAKDGDDAVKVTCLSYKATITCLKKYLAKCTGPTEFRIVKAFYSLLEAEMEVCKSYLPEPKETCVIKEAKECFAELEKTVSSVTDGDYTKVCTEINTKQSCVYDKIAGCTDFTTYLWVAHMRDVTFLVTKSKKCEGKITPPKPTGKECEKAKATECMYEFEEYSLQAAFSNSYGHLCLKLVEFKTCIEEKTAECTDEQNDGRLRRFRIKYAMMSPWCLSTVESAECKFKEVRERLEKFAKGMLTLVMVKAKVDVDDLCNNLQTELSYAWTTKQKCSLSMKVKIDKLAMVTMKQLTTNICKDKGIIYAPDVKPTCKIIEVEETVSAFRVKIVAGLAAEPKDLEFCGALVFIQTTVTTGLKDCGEDKAVTAIRTKMTAIITLIGTHCEKRFDVVFPFTKRDVEDGDTVIVKYKFEGCVDVLCDGKPNCQVRIFHTLTNLRGNAKCGKNERYLIQGAFQADSCGFDLTTANCANEFELVIRGRVFYIKQKSQQRDVIFYARVTIGGVVTYVKLKTKLMINFVHSLVNVKPCRVWGDPHFESYISSDQKIKKSLYNIFTSGFATLVGDQANEGNGVQLIFSQCFSKRPVSCACAVYIKCGGGMIMVGNCARKNPKAKKKCSSRRNRKQKIGGACSTKTPNRKYLNIDIKYNGVIDNCRIVRKSAYEYYVYQAATGRKIMIKQHGKGSHPILEILLYYVKSDITQKREGLCFATQSTYKKHLLPWQQTYASERWANWVTPATKPSCLCTSNQGKDKKIQISETCGAYEMFKECKYFGGKSKDVTKAWWEAAVRIDAGAGAARKKRAVNTNPFTVDPNLPAQDPNKWGPTFDDAKATKACTDYFDDFKNKMLKGCLDQTKMDITSDMTTCKEDVKVSDSTDFVESAASSCFTKCINLLQQDTAYMNSPAGQTLTTSLSAQTCPNSCSGRGKCVGGVCDCPVQYKGEACDVDVNQRPNIIAVGTNGGVCNPSLANCSILIIEASNVLDSTALTCHFLEQKYGTSGKTDVGTVSSVRGEYVSGAVRCILPKSVSYAIAISNNGKDMSGAYSYLVNDPQCETCDINTGTCKPATVPVCRVGSVCYTSGQSLKENNCFICNPKESDTKLVLNKADPKCGGKPTKPTGLDYTDIIIIVVVVAGIVLGISAFLIYNYIAKPKIQAKNKAKQLEKERKAESQGHRTPQPPSTPRYSEPPTHGDPAARYVEDQQMPGGSH